MAKLEITLHEKGGDVTYKQHHVSGQKYLDFWNIQEKIEVGNLTTTEIIKLRLEFIAGLFLDDKLTPEQILQGTDPWELDEMIIRINNIVLGMDKNTEKKN